MRIKIVKKRCDKNANKGYELQTRTSVGTIQGMNGKGLKNMAQLALGQYPLEVDKKITITNINNITKNYVESIVEIYRYPYQSSNGVNQGQNYLMWIYKGLK